MPYCEYRPHALLRAVVDCYWSMASASGFHQPTKEYQLQYRKEFMDHVGEEHKHKRGRENEEHQHGPTHTVYPDGCTDIIFNFGDPMITKSPSYVNDHPVFIVGIMTTSILTGTAGVQDLFGIRFKAGGMNKVIRNPMNEFTDQSLTIREAQHQLPEDLYNRMLDSGGVERALLVDKWLMSQVAVPSRLSVWEWCVDQVVRTHGNTRISRLAKEAAISEKQLERNFLLNVGVTPKQFSTIIRFCEAKQRLDCKPSALETLAWDLGYTDHAHFTKSFKRFAGITPSEYLKHRRAT